MNHSSTSLNYITNNRQVNTTTTKSKPRFRPPLDLDDDDDIDFNSSFYGKAEVEEEKHNNSDVDNSDRLHESIRSITDIFAVHQESSRSLVKSGDIIFDDSERTILEEDEEEEGDTSLPSKLPPNDVSERTAPETEDEGTLRLSHQSDASSVGDVLAVHQTAYTQRSRSRSSPRQDLPISKLSFTSAKVAKKLLPLVAEVAFESSTEQKKKERKPNRLSIEGLTRPKSSDSFTNLRSTQQSLSNEDKNTSWGLVRRKSSGSFGSTRNKVTSTTSSSSDSNNKNASWDINNNTEAVQQQPPGTVLYKQPGAVLYKRKPSSDSLVSLELQSTKAELENVKAQLAELRSRSLTPSARRRTLSADNTPIGTPIDVSERTTPEGEDESTLRLSHQSDASSVGDVLAVHQTAYTAPSQQRRRGRRKTNEDHLPISKLSFTSAKVAKKLLPLVAEVAFESDKPSRLARPRSSDDLVVDEDGSRPSTPPSDNITGMPRCIPPIDVSERTTESGAAVGLEDEDESALRLSHQSNASSVGDVLAVHQTAYAPRRSSRRRSMGDTPDKNPLQLSFTSAKLAKKLLPQVEEVTNEGGESNKETKKNKKERKPNRLSIEGLRVPTKEGPPPTRPAISRRHSMSDVAPASRWSLALAKYEKDKPQEDKKKGSPSSKSSSTVLRSRRASTGDCPDEVLDFEGLTPKLSREVERLSQSSGTALTVCSELESSVAPSIGLSKLEEEEGSGSEEETPPKNASSSAERSKKSDEAQFEDKSNSKSSKLSSLDNLKNDVKKKNKKNKLRPKHHSKKMSTSMSDVYEKTSKQKKSKSKKSFDKRSLYFKSISVDNLLDESVSSLEASLRSTGLDESVNSNDVSELFNRLMALEDCARE